MSHYFENDNNLRSETRELTYKFDYYTFTFLSDNGVFSKKAIDFGSKLLLETYLKDDTKELKVLDVGCGYGLLGTVISVVNNSYVEMVDVNKRAVHLSKRNTKKLDKFNGKIYESDAYQNVEGKFDVVITNPPIRVGKSKVLEILDGAFDYLNENGSLYFVIRKDQGALSIKKILESNNRKVELLNKDKGYYIFKVKC